MICFTLAEIFSLDLMNFISNVYSKWEYTKCKMEKVMSVKMKMEMNVKENVGKQKVINKQYIYISLYRKWSGLGGITQYFWDQNPPLFINKPKKIKYYAKRKTI